METTNVIKTEKGDCPPNASKNIEELPCKEFTVKNKENQTFSLKVYKGDKSIFFHVKEIGDIGDTLYKAESSLENFHKLNRIFRQFLSTEELFSFYFQMYNEKDISISKGDKKIKLTFIVEFMGKKNDVCFTLNPEQSKIENVVMNLCDKVKDIDELKNIIKEQNEKFNNLKIEFENFKKSVGEKINDVLKNEIKNIKNENDIKIKDLETKLTQKEKYINELKNEINNMKTNTNNFMNASGYNIELFNDFKKTIDSQIIRYDELSLIDDGIKYKFNKKVKNYKLLFRASRDGFRANDFHSKCDGKNYTITFVITSIGRRFGGFTDQAWDQSGNYKTGSNGFIFSLNNKEIYYNKNSSYNIRCHSSYGPSFGGGYDFYICDNCNTSYSSYNNSDHSYETYGKKCVMAGTYNFYVKDYEVFQIELE